LGGEAQITSAPGAGTTIILSIDPRALHTSPP